MGHVEGSDREQMTLFPEALDDYVSPENPVRFVDAFVDGLDMEQLGFTHAVPNELGRPPYDPADLLRLFIYGYLNRLRSSRRLEREANRNVELMWLLRRLAPDFKTLADFRKDNAQAIRGVCREFITYCRELRLFGGEFIAIDGSKFKAVNARHRNFSARKLKNQTDELDAKIQEYLDELERNDQEEADLPTLTAEELKQKIEILRERKRKLRALGKQMDQSGQTQVSLTDPDSRSMPAGKGHGTDVAYNVQVTVDSKHKLILDHEVTNDPTDRGHLSTMAIRAKHLLGVKRLQAVADMGYREACCALRRPGGQVVCRSGDQDLHPQAPHLDQPLPGSLHQGRLPLQPPERLLSMPGRTAADVSLPDPRTRSRRPILRHRGLRLLPSQA